MLIKHVPVHLNNSGERVENGVSATFVQGKQVTLKYRNIPVQLNPHDSLSLSISSSVTA